MEEVAVVNEQDQVLGYKLRRDLLPTDRIRISAIWVTNKEGEILLAQRAFDRKTDPGCWGPAAEGVVEKTETFEENAHKELAEELGVKHVKLTKLRKHCYDTNRGHRRICQWFSLEWNEPTSKLTLQTEEVAAAQWITKSDLLREIKNHPDQYVANAQMWDELFQFKA